MAILVGSKMTLKGSRSRGNGIFVWFHLFLTANSESRAGFVLFGDVHLNLFSVKVVKFLGDFFPCQFGRVAVAAEMYTENVLQVDMDKLLQEIGRAFIGKMSVPAEDALLEVPWPMWIIVQHVHVVVGFQQQHLGLAHAIGN